MYMFIILKKGLANFAQRAVVTALTNRDLKKGMVLFGQKKRIEKLVRRIVGRIIGTGKVVRPGQKKRYEPGFLKIKNLLQVDLVQKSVMFVKNLSYRKGIKTWHMTIVTKQGIFVVGYV